MDKALYKFIIIIIVIFIIVNMLRESRYKVEHTISFQLVSSGTYTKPLLLKGTSTGQAGTITVGEEQFFKYHIYSNKHPPSNKRPP